MAVGGSGRHSRRASRHPRGSGDPQRAERLAGQIPFRRPADPAEIAAPICWLLSDAAAYTTGAVLRVAGGL